MSFIMWAFGDALNKTAAANDLANRNDGNSNNGHDYRSI